MITIEGKEYLNYVEALYELAAQIDHLYENVYDKEEIATIVSGITDRINALSLSTEESLTQVREALATLSNSTSALLDRVAALEEYDQTVRTSIESLYNVIVRHEELFNAMSGRIAALENRHLYCHNITLSYRHTNQTLASEGSDGAWEATFTVINSDPTSYNFNHYPAYDTPTIMSAANAWQLYRLYTALQIGHKKNEEPERPASGAAMHVNYASGSYSLEKGINNDIKTKYYNFSDLDEYKRLIVINSTLISPTRGLGGLAFELSCGHAVFDSNNVEVLWDNYDDWYVGEYNKTTLSDPSKTYRTYYSYQRVSCLDSVEQLY